MGTVAGPLAQALVLPTNAVQTEGRKRASGSRAPSAAPQPEVGGQAESATKHTKHTIDGYLGHLSDGVADFCNVGDARVRVGGRAGGVELAGIHEATLVRFLNLLPVSAPRGGAEATGMAVVLVLAVCVRRGRGVTVLVC